MQILYLCFWGNIQKCVDTAQKSIYNKEKNE